MLDSLPPVQGVMCINNRVVIEIYQVWDASTAGTCRHAWNYLSLAMVDAHGYYKSPLCVLVYWVLQTSVRGQVLDHEREDVMAVRLLKAERFKVRMCNHARTNMDDTRACIILVLLCSGGSRAAKGHRAPQRVWGQQRGTGSGGLFAAVADYICTSK